MLDNVEIEVNGYKYSNVISLKVTNEYIIVECEALDEDGNRMIGEEQKNEMVNKTWFDIKKARCKVKMSLDGCICTNRII